LENVLSLICEMMKIKFLISCLVCILLGSVTLVNADYNDWLPVWNLWFGSYAANYQDLWFDSSGNPIILHRYSDNSMAVMSYSTSMRSEIWSLTTQADSVLAMVVRSNGYPVVAFRDKNNGNRLTVIERNGSNRIVMWTAWFSLSPIVAVDIELKADWIPVVIYSEFVSMHTSPVTAMVRDSESRTDLWISVFSNYADLAIDSNDYLYIVYNDNSKISVQKYDTKWSQVGSAEFSAGSAYTLNIDIKSNDIPVVSYFDATNNKVMAQEFSEKSWTILWPVDGFSSWAANDVDMKIDSSDNIIVAYRDASNNNRASAKKYSEWSWSTLWSLGFWSWAVSYVSVGIDATDIPYIAYRDAGNNDKTTVTKLTEILTCFDWINTELFNGSCLGVEAGNLKTMDGSAISSFEDIFCGNKVKVSLSVRNLSSTASKYVWWKFVTKIAEFDITEKLESGVKTTLQEINVMVFKPTQFEDLLMTVD